MLKKDVLRAALYVTDLRATGDLEVSEVDASAATGLGLDAVARWVVSRV